MLFEFYDIYNLVLIKLLSICHYVLRVKGQGQIYLKSVLWLITRIALKLFNTGCTCLEKNYCLWHVADNLGVKGKGEIYVKSIF